MERIDDGNKVTRLIVEADIESAQLLQDGELGYSGTLKRWIDLGDHVLVDPSAYFEPRVDDAGTEVVRKRPFVWGRVHRIAAGSAATYPVKVEFDPEAAGFAAEGQYKVTEVLAVRHGDHGEAEYWRESFNWDQAP